MSRHRFNCPSCEADIVVDGNVRTGILADGCPICLVPVTDEAFTPTVNAGR